VILSMTGFGAASEEAADLKAWVTVRSLNHRFLELSLHVPRRLLALEPRIKGLIQTRLGRGKVDAAVRASFADDAAGEVTSSPALIVELVRALREIEAGHGLEGGVTLEDVIRFPGAVEVQERASSLDEGRQQRILGLVGRALEELRAMRRAEGAQLASALEERLAAIEAAAGSIEQLAEAGKAARCQALLEKLRGLAAELGLDEARLYQEVVRAAERADVAEELARLRSHVAQARELMGGESACGKRLDFLAQELMREANTIGSKSASAELTQQAVGLKAEIERFREQVQNVE